MLTGDPDTGFGAEQPASEGACFARARTSVRIRNRQQSVPSYVRMRSGHRSYSPTSTFDPQIVRRWEWADVAAVSNRAAQHRAVVGRPASSGPRDRIVEPGPFPEVWSASGHAFGPLTRLTAS